MLAPTDPQMHSSLDELQAPLVGLADRDTSLQHFESEEDLQEGEYQPGEGLFGSSHNFLSDRVMSCSVSDPVPFANPSHPSQMEVGVTNSSTFNLIGVEAKESNHATDVPDSSMDSLATSEAAAVPLVETSVTSILAETPTDDKHERSLSPGEIVSPSPGPETSIGVVPDDAPQDPSALCRESSHTSPVKHRRPSSPSNVTGRYDRPSSSQSLYRSGLGYYYRSRSPDRYRRRSRSPPRRRYRRSQSCSASPKFRYGKGSSSQSSGLRRWRPRSRVESPPPARCSSRRRRTRSRSRSLSPKDRRGRGRRSRSVSLLARSHRSCSHSPPTRRKRSRSPTSRSSNRPYERERDRESSRSDSRTRSSYSRDLRRHSKSLSPPSSHRRRESAGSESEEQLELLELKRQAIMSMIGPAGASDSKSEWEVVSVYESEPLPSDTEDPSKPNDGATINSIPKAESLTDVRAGEQPESFGAGKGSELATKELSSSIATQSVCGESAPVISGVSEQRKGVEKSREMREKAEGMKEQKVDENFAAQEPTKNTPSCSGGIIAIAAGSMKPLEPAELSAEPASQVKRVGRAVTPVVERPKVAAGVAKLTARAPVRLKTPSSGPPSSTVQHHLPTVQSLSVKASCVCEGV